MPTGTGPCCGPHRSRSWPRRKRPYRMRAVRRLRAARGELSRQRAATNAGRAHRMGKKKPATLLSKGCRLVPAWGRIAYHSAAPIPPISRLHACRLMNRLGFPSTVISPCLPPVPRGLPHSCVTSTPIGVGARPWHRSPVPLQPSWARSPVRHAGPYGRPSRVGQRAGLGPTGRHRAPPSADRIPFRAPQPAPARPLSPSPALAPGAVGRAKVQPLVRSTITRSSRRLYRALAARGSARRAASPRARAVSIWASVGSAMDLLPAGEQGGLLVGYDTQGPADPAAADVRPPRSARASRQRRGG